MDSGVREAPSPALGDRQLRPLYAVLLLAAFAYSLLQSLVVPALPAIQHDLHAGTATVTWAFTGFLISTAVATPIVGRLSDMYGRARVLTVVLFALTVGTLICAVATDIVTLLVGRFVQGIGGGFFAVAFGIVRDEFPHHRVASVIGVISAMLAVAGTTGLTLSGWIVARWSWHWLFWASLVLDITTLVLATAVVPKRKAAGARRLDIGGAVLLSAWLVALLLAVSEGPAWGWSSIAVLGLAGSSVGLLVCWVALEQTRAAPLVDMALLIRPAVWRINAASILFGFSMYASWATVSLFVQVPHSTGWGLGASQASAGVYLVPSSIATFLAGLMTGRIEARWGSRRCMVTGALVAAMMYAALATWHTSPWQPLLILTVAGFGQGLAFASMSNIVVASVSADQVGVAVGLNTNARTIGGAVGAQVAATVIAANTLLDVPAQRGYVVDFAMFALVFIAAALVASRVPRMVWSPDAEEVEREVTAGAATALPVGAGS